MTLPKRIKKSRQQEKEGMARHGGTTNAGSGTGWRRRHDGRTSSTTIEFKRTDNRKQITIKTNDLLSVERVALSEGRQPVLQFELNSRNYVIVTEDDYLELRSKADGGSSAVAPTRTGRRQ